MKTLLPKIASSFKIHKHLIILLVLSFTSLHSHANKIIVGATEEILVGDQNLSFSARIDTGAKTSSIHAENLQFDPSTHPQGKPISFLIINKQGDSRKIETYVDSITKINTSEGSEHRFKVPLTIKWKHITKTILVTLNDRSKMKYGLLLGRNWLTGHFVVNVDKNNEE